MDTTNIYLTTKEAIEESKKKDGLIPSEFLATFPNNFGINLCAVKGFNVEKTGDNQYKSITVDFLPVPEKLNEPYFFIVDNVNWGADPIIIQSEYDLDDDTVTDFLNKDEDEWQQYEVVYRIPVSQLKIFA